MFQETNKYTIGLRRTFYNYKHMIPIYVSELEATLGECNSILDVGCGSHSPLRYLSMKSYSVGIDIHQPSIQKSRRSNIHSEYICGDILSIEKYFKPNSFDCVVAFDVIEHLYKEDGWKLIDQMEKIARNKIIIFTPNGFLSQGEYDNNPWQVHRSGWTVSEMRSLDYNIIGIDGWKPLRKECATIRFRPRRVWRAISDLTQIIVRTRPEHAFALLCIKDKMLDSSLLGCE